VIGPSGIGKTSLVKAVAKTGQFTTAYEQHETRPFQALASQDSGYTFANQMDYLLLRVEQEKKLRVASRIGLMDGGLDLDFHGFTRLFLSRNLLSQNEYDLCRRFYLFAREHLPLPELIIRLEADAETVTNRLSGRKRVNIANAKDVTLFNSLLDEWLASVPSEHILKLDITNESMDYQHSVETILDTIKKTFDRSPV